MKHSSADILPNDDQKEKLTEGKPKSNRSVVSGPDKTRGEFVKKFWVPRLNDQGKIELIQAYLYRNHVGRRGSRPPCPSNFGENCHGRVEAELVDIQPHFYERCDEHF